LRLSDYLTFKRRRSQWRG